MPAKRGQLFHILAERERFEVVIGYRFLLETLDMHKTAGVVVIGITLAAHTTRTVLLQGVEITADYLLRLPLFFLRNGK